MRRRPAVDALFALALFAALVVGVGPADAQVPDPVEEAQLERDEAAAKRAAADARRDRAADASRRARDLVDQVGSDLGAAVRSYRQVNTELAEVTYRIADLREIITDREADLRELRRATRDYVIDAYMAGGSNELDVFFSVDTYTEMITTRAVLNRTSELNIGLISDVDAGRRELGDLHASHDADQELLRRLKEESSAVVSALDELFAEAAGDSSIANTELDVARNAVADAEAEYQEAARRLDEEIEKRRRLSSPGVEKWRPLVERYFPPERVAQAMAVMSCESSGVATVTHTSSGAAGLFQFMAGTWGFASAEAGFAGSSPYDPEANVASAAWLVAYSIRTSHPWGPWGRWSCRTVLY